MIAEVAISLLLSLRPDVAHLTPAVVELGGQVVAAEARGESFVEQVSVASVIGNRVRCREHSWGRRTRRNPWVGVMRAPLQFAKPAPESVTRDVHRLAFIIGAVMPLGWRGDAYFFATTNAADEGFVARRATDGYEPIPDVNSPHVYFRRMGDG